MKGRRKRNISHDLRGRGCDGMDFNEKKKIELFVF